ncbi:HALOACID DEHALOGENASE-LIKE HYDROLASE (HAD) SUPERFAMILY PROTEIN [Salix viminalis]|uniref:HALOACID DEHALOGENASE-LIKE HYDROLASE (HAD) SUPERFAMILY PROTEIN n=1 Tax=Salix viminalis TaxID=40686 RepID=A0A9Q0QJJ0_SALVM|nr:HALOACID DEHALOGENASE-LIKE HYDROLASE (HAD) SUPERFAMILY PROTEIN [Salix viminalis]
MEAPEVLTSRKRKLRERNTSRNNQQDSDPDHKQAEGGDLTSTCNLNNVSTVYLADESNKEASLSSDNSETKLVNEGMETVNEALEVLSLGKRKARKRIKRKNNQHDSDPAYKQAEESGMLSTCNLNTVSTDSDPAHKQAEESGMLSTCNLNNVSTVCLSDGSNKEAVFLSDNGETKLVNEGMETVKEALEVPSLRKRKARKRSKRKNKQQDSDPAHKQAEESGMLSTCNLNNVSTVCLSDGSNKEAVFLSDNGETKHVNEGMETVKEALEVPSLRKRKARKKSKRKNKQQDSDPAHKQAEESGMLSTCNLNNVSTVCLSDERNREVAFCYLDNGKTKLVNEGMGTTKEAPEVPSLKKRKARRRNKRKNNQQDSDPAQKQAEESGMLSSCNLNNVSSTFLSDESNREAVFLSDNGETKLVNEGMETVKEALEVPSLQKRKARKKSKRKNKQQDSDPAHKQAEESGMLSTSNLNNVPIVCLSDERNKEVALLLDSGKTKLVNEGMGTTKEAPEVPSLQERKARRRNKRRNNQQDSDPAHKQVEDGGMLSTYNLNSMSTVCLSDETDREVLLSDKGETELVNKGPETTKEASEVPSLQNTKARRRNRRGNSSQDNETSSVSHAICGKENVPLESLSCLLEITPIPVRKKLLILDINGVLVDIVSSPPKGHIADIKIAKRAIFRRPFCFDFLNFCFERFEVGIWSSRTRKNVDSVIEFAMGDMQKKLLFCWDLSKCTATQFRTLENRHKPLVFKELRRIWEKDDSELPWEKGDYSESNTMLLDDSPYKALLNPAHTAIFPYPYQFQNRNDNSLGAGGDIRVYLEELAAADNVQEFCKTPPIWSTSYLSRKSKLGLLPQGY